MDKWNNLHIKLSEPLNEKDTETTTYGCRANNPDICFNCMTENVCAFVREDHMCQKPSRAWKKFYNQKINK